MATAKYASVRDYEIDHLLGGPDSDRLEFNSDYYRAEFSRARHTPLRDFFLEYPDMIRHHAVLRAAHSGLNFFSHPDNELRPCGTENRYNDAAEHTISEYIATDRAPQFTVDGLSYEKRSVVPQFELREVGRLALQRFQVYETVVATGEVPEL